MLIYKYYKTFKIVVCRGEKGIVADAGIVADNDISITIIVIKK